MTIAYIISIGNCIGSIIAVIVLYNSLKKKEYNPCYHNFMLIFIFGLVCLVLASIYIFFQTDISWVMRLLGHIIWILAFFFVSASKDDYKKRRGDEKKAKTKADEECDEKLINGENLNYEQKCNT